MEHNNASSKKLSREQKTGFVLLLLFSILTISFAFLQMRNTIYNPYAIRISEKTQAENVFDFDETTRLQQIDTDQDGLNDYEELYFYNTSPYIPDTDSDGIDDATELKSGSDPLCPQGQTCGEQVLIGAASSSQPSFSLGQEGVPTVQDIVKGSITDDVLRANGLSDTVPQDQTALDVNKLLHDPAALRELLLTTGQISTEELAQISDSRLMEIANVSAEQVSSTLQTE